MFRMIDELRFVLRQLRKAPGFAVTVILTLALGIAATTAIFSLVDAVLLRPLPLPGADRLMSLGTLQVASGAGANSAATIEDETSYPNFFDWRSRSKSFSSMASYTTVGLILGATADGPARSVRAAQVSSGFFTTLGVRPELGRDFRLEEELPGTRVVVLSHELWETEFAADTKIVGRTVAMSDQRYTVVGVMPRGFRFPVTNLGVAAWTTMARDAEGQNPSTQQRGWNQLLVVGRLKDGITVARAKAEMDAIQSGLAKQYPAEAAREPAVSVVPQLKSLVADVAKPLQLLFGAVCCLLLIVCANVAGMLLTRTSQRRGELAVRSALGATRSQLLRLLMMESLLLSVIGGAVGVMATSVLLKVAPKVLPSNLPRIGEVALDGRVMLFAITISGMTGLVFGVLPAMRASKQDPAKALGEAGRGGILGRRHFRLQNALVIAQTAIGLVLLMGAGLLIRSFDKTLRVDPGFSPENMVSFRVSVPVECCEQPKQIRFVEQVLEQLKTIPGVKETTASYPLPLTQEDMSISFGIEGKPALQGDKPSARVSVTAARYFETLRIPLKRGRLFGATEQEPKGAAVVIVNEAFANKFFPGQEALGQHIKSGIDGGTGPDDKTPYREIVGVVGNVKRLSLTEPDRAEYYIPFEQAPVSMPAIAMRVTGNPERYAKIVATEVEKLDRGVPVYRFTSYGEDIARITAQQRFQTLLLGAFAAIALLLAGLGLYAVLSFMVSQRSSELGLRIALGAPRGNVLRLMLLNGLRMTSIGLCLGLVAAGLLTRFVAGLLYGVRPLDAATLVSTTVVLLAVSAIASLIPAYRAAMLDPNETLRQQ